MITTDLKVTNCTACNIAKSRLNIVSGKGNINASIMFIGEAPGHTEDKMGEPFVGESGKVLTRALFNAGFTREEVYITNMIKCKPPRNRIPSAVELNNCVNNLIYEINTIKPKIIVLLGRTALQNVLGKRYSLAMANNRIVIRDNFVFMPMYHPSYILRQQSTNVSRKYIQNFLLLELVYRKLVDPLHRPNI